MADPTEQYTAEQLEAMESVSPSPAQEQEIPRENRRTIAVESALGPDSLCGSWALYHCSDDTKQGLVVAEPQPGVYLVELYDVVTDSPREQRLVKLDDLAKIDDDGGLWTFYDDRAGVRSAFKRLLS